MHYNLPPWSISILPDCKNAVFNTARVRKIYFQLDFICFAQLFKYNGVHQIFSCVIQVTFQTSHMTMAPANTNEFSWETYNEDTASYDDNSMRVVGLLEQINTTKDVTDYLWYMTE